MTGNFQKMDLGIEDFQKVRSMLYKYSGIYLHEGKQALVRARLMKRMRKLGLNSFWEYLNYVEKDESGAEFLSLIDVLTTNKTSFFRENQHFDFMREEIIPNMNGRTYKWWSAGCSSGEEPISMAITLLEEKRSETDLSVKILATDLSRDILQKAKAGIYTDEKLNGVPGFIRNRYFEKKPGQENSYKIGNRVRNMVSYGRLNLNESWPMKGPFHVIMCRNVMIYFNRETQQNLISRFRDLLEPDGFLFLGHSESVAGKDQGFVNICPAVYKKVEG